uniref:Uncharacterized protein n=1 Tax=Amphimedon queenslandica TaxID=400682 RepID=A0A1X7VPG2_AMPQE
MENTALIPFPPRSVDDDEEENPQIIQNKNDSPSFNSREPLIIPQPLVISQPQLTRDFHLVYRCNQSPSDNFLMLTIIQLFLLSPIGFTPLFCLIPALYFVFKARDAEMAGDIFTMYSKRQTALILNFFGFLAGFVTIAIITLYSIIYSNSTRN